MSWIDQLFRRNQYKVVSETLGMGTPTYSGANFENRVKNGFRKNELIFACISKTASTASQVSLKFSKGTKELTDHPVNKLIQKPNPYMSEYDFWASTIIYQKLAGVAYWEKVRSQSGRLVELWPLRPDWMSPVVSGSKITGYTYRKNQPEQTTLLSSDVVRFPLFDPLNIFSSWSPALVAARVGDVDNSTTDFLKLFMERGGTPPGILKTVQRLDDNQVTNIRERWRQRYGGYKSWLDPAVLDADASYQQIGSSFNEMGFEVLDSRNESRICMVFDIPPILVGAKTGLDRSTYSNYREARTAWWEDSLMPLYTNFLDVVINQILSEFEPGISVQFDISRITALQEDISARWARSTAAWNSGGLTLNEYRSELGYQIVANGDRFKSEFVDPTGVLETQKDLMVAITELKSLPSSRLRNKHEAKIQAAMERFFNQELIRIKDEIESQSGSQSNAE